MIELPMALLDAAFVQATPHGGLPSNQQAALAKLATLFPHCSQAQIAQAYATARRLVDACYDVGEACRAGSPTRVQAEAQLQAAFPGFSHDVYSQAVSYGLFISR